MIDTFKRLENNLDKVKKLGLLNKLAREILDSITVSTIDSQIQKIVMKKLEPQIYEGYKIYDLGQPMDTREFTYFEIEYNDKQMETHHHKKQNAVVTVLSGVGEAYIGGIKSSIEKGSIIYLPAGISHGIVAKRDSLLKLLSIQDIPILNENGTRDFHLDRGEFKLEEPKILDDYIVL